MISELKDEPEGCHVTDGVNEKSGREEKPLHTHHQHVLSLMGLKEGTPEYEDADWNLTCMCKNNYPLYFKITTFY